MKILSINTESSSLKFSLFDMKDESVITSGLFERIGLEGSCYHIRYNGEKITQEVELNGYNDVVRVLLEKLIDLEIIKSLDEIDGVGHRLIQGKDKFLETTFMNEDILKELENMNDFVSLNNSYNILGIRAFMKYLPNCPMVGVFDTSFNQTMDEVTYLYSVPYKWYKEYGVRKYGFHGTAHKYVANAIKNEMGKSNFKLISCHLDNSGSVTAIKDMKCVDTSMGFTPLSGIMMGNRSGDIDPSIIPYVMEREGKNVGEVIDDLNRNSGLLGISEFSSDMRDIISKCDEGDDKALLARSKYVRRVVDYIAEYYVLLGGADVISFSGNIGENVVPIRREICEKLACLGIEIDLDMNSKMGEQVKISTDKSSVDVFVIPVDEELMLARDTVNKIKNR